VLTEIIEGFSLQDVKQQNEPLGRRVTLRVRKQTNYVVAGQIQVPNLTKLRNEG